MTRPALRVAATFAAGLCAGLMATSMAAAKLPPLSDDAKAKAAEAAAKTAHGNKVADYQLCKSMQRVADQYRADAKKAGKTVGSPTDTPACADPGAFVYTPPAPAAAPTAAAAPAAAPAPSTTATAAAAAPKK